MLQPNKGETRRVLLVVQTLLTYNVLQEYSKALVCDPRVDLFITLAEEKFSDGAREAVANSPFETISLTKARSISWDLVIFAAHGAAPHFSPKIPKMRILHGIGRPAKFVNGEPYSYSSQYTVRPDGKPVYDWLLEPSAHTAQLVVDRLPQLRDAMRVVGSLEMDRMLRLQNQRRTIRKALGIGDGDVAILMSSAWGPHGLLEQFGHELLQQVNQLPRRFKLLVTAHPHVWIGDGSIPSAWARRLDELPPSRARVCGRGQDWAPYLVAADVGLFDYSSIAIYMSALAIPTVAVPISQGIIDPTSTSAMLRAVSPLWSPGMSLKSTVTHAIESFDAQLFAEERDAICAYRGESQSRVREVLYQALGLTQTVVLQARPPKQPSFRVTPMQLSQQHVSDIERLYAEAFRLWQTKAIRRKGSCLSARTDEAKRVLTNIYDVELAIGHIQAGFLRQHLSRFGRPAAGLFAPSQVDERQIRALGARAALNEYSAIARNGGTASNNKRALAVQLFWGCVVDGVVNDAFGAADLSSAPDGSQSAAEIVLG